MNEKWTQWKPNYNLSNKYYVESVTDNMEGFKIKLFDTIDINKKIILDFNKDVEAYRSAEEIYSVKIISYLHKTYGSDFYGNWTFFKVENSKYVRWLSEECDEAINLSNLTHFTILASDFIIDIITIKDPKIQFVEEKNE